MKPPARKKGEEYAAVFALQYAAGDSVPAIAAGYGMPHTTVYSRLKDQKVTMQPVAGSYAGSGEAPR